MEAHRTAAAGLAGLSLLALSACGGGSEDPFAEQGDGAGGGEALVVGSQQYYSNEILAEIYAQVLESEGYEIQRDYEIGQREVYAAELEAGNIDVFPEYTGNLLQYFDPDSEAQTAEEIESGLGEALPEGLTALESAEATDQNVLVVTSEFAEAHDLVSIGDLAGIEDLVVGASPEFAERPYGPDGLSEVYGVEVELQTIDDSGGPLTVNALLDGEVDATANIYSSSPAIAEHGLVALEDPEELVPPQNIVPIVSENVDEEARELLDGISAALSQEDLLELNTRSVEEQESAEVIAEDWLQEQGLLD